MTEDGSAHLDPRSLRALAHPLRLALLGLLREYGPATATGLAGRVGESSGLTSYHLRQLAAHGFVVEDLERGSRRERWWRAAHANTVLGPELTAHPDPEVAGAMAALMHEVAAVHTRQLDTWLGTSTSWSPDWQRSADVSDFALPLTPGRARALTAELHEVVERYRVPEDGPGDDDGERARVAVQVRVFPRPPA